MSGTTLCALHILIHLILQQPYEVGILNSDEETKAERD